MRGRCTTAIHSAPPRYLVAWHQDKNPEDGSCGTDCPQAQPGNGHVFAGKPVGRPIFVVPLPPMPLPALSSRSQLSSRAPPWCSLRTNAPSWRRPHGIAPPWRLLSGRPPPWCSQRTGMPLLRNLQGSAPPWPAPRHLCADMARAQWRGSIVVPPYASVAPVQWRRAIVVPPTYTCAIVAQSSGQSTTAALPRQPCADVAPVQ